eukprot:6197462-Pleurochrysis_carterae.AAC.4
MPVAGATKKEKSAKQDEVAKAGRADDSGPKRQTKTLAKAAKPVAKPKSVTKKTTSKRQTTTTKGAQGSKNNAMPIERAAKRAGKPPGTKKPAALERNMTRAPRRQLQFYIRRDGEEIQVSGDDFIRRALLKFGMS